MKRDIVNGWVGGVCAGIGNHFGIDPFWIRAGFVILASLGGSSLLIYLILWLLMPNE